MKNSLKVVSATFSLGYFLSVKKITCETRKNVFYFTSKVLFVLKKIYFRILDIEVSWCYQIPKHEIRNTFFSE